MPFVRYAASTTKYQGTSFVRTLTRKDGEPWASTHSSDWVLVDEYGVTIATGNLIKVNIDLGLRLEVHDSETTDLKGLHKLFVYLHDSDNTTLSDIIMEYSITFKTIAAT